MVKRRTTKITENYGQKGVYTVWQRITKGKFAGRFKTKGYIAKAKTKGTNNKIRLAFIGDDYDDRWQEIKFKFKKK